MNSWKDFENHVHYVYSSILNMKDEGILVSRNAKIFGKSGALHEIDVYYEFNRAGVRHKVAIECKSLSRPVEKGKIQEFCHKISDIGNIVGIAISKKGFQEGAKTISEYYGINLVNYDDLPSFLSIFSKRIETVLLPDETYVGEPFWTIMEAQNGRVTGSYFVIPHDGTGKNHVPLFFSKAHAEKAFLECGLSYEKWAVRGLPRFALRAFIMSCELMNLNVNNIGGAAILFLPPGAIEGAGFAMMAISREQLISEYYGAPVPSIKINR
ncbi:restriction endonuclease [Asaia sp. As-1742]|uniref:restriction endonuclease n=1 Tax=Asaia sp. As-1742 TaxID=2608325 RepID=UPI0014227458|nr:restriction endonuclease [Asaia sp. As-1742]NIE81145.1 hypothetical protein [Asaia sp. As-1742]